MRRHYSTYLSFAVLIGLIFGWSSCGNGARRHYVSLNSPGHPALERFIGHPQYMAVDNMPATAQFLQAQGFVLLGYSQFVSPEPPDKIHERAIEEGARVRARLVALENAKRGGNLNFGYLMTFWGRASDYILGAYYEDLPPEILRRMGEGNNAVVIKGVVENTPAEKASFSVGDIIIAVDELPVTSAANLDRILKSRSGTSVKIFRWTDGGPQNQTVNLSSASRVAADLVRMGGGTLYQENPWLQTRAKDWSYLGRIKVSELNSVFESGIPSYQQLDQSVAKAPVRAGQEFMKVGEASAKVISQYKDFVSRYKKSWEALGNDPWIRQRKFQTWWDYAPDIFFARYQSKSDIVPNAPLQN